MNNYYDDTSIEDLSEFENDLDIVTEAKELSSGIFWIITEDPGISYYELLMFDIPCDSEGNTTENMTKLNSKNGLTYNHKRIWDEVVKGSNIYKSFNRKEYNYYPRGRIDIANNKATIYLNPNINRDDIIEEIKREFGLSEYNISKVRVITDNSFHYRCFIDKD